MKQGTPALVRSIGVFVALVLLVKAPLLAGSPHDLSAITNRLAVLDPSVLTSIPKALELVKQAIGGLSQADRDSAFLAFSAFYYSEETNFKYSKAVDAFFVTNGIKPLLGYQPPLR